MQTRKRPQTVFKDAVFGKVEPVQWVQSASNTDQPIIDGDSVNYGNPTTIHQRRGVSSRQTAYKGDFAIEFPMNELRPQLSGAFYATRINAIAVGLSNYDLDSAEDSIGWGVVHAWINGTGMPINPTYAQAQEAETGLLVRESGVIKATITGVKVGSKIRIAAEDGFVNYYLDGERFYTSTTPVTYPLVADASLMGEGARIEEAKLIRGGAPVIHGSIKRFSDGGSSGFGSYLKGYEIRQIIQSPAGSITGASPQVTTTMAGVFNIYLTGKIRLLTPNSKVLVIANINGLRRFQANIGGKVVIYSCGRIFYLSPASASAGGARTNSPYEANVWSVLSGDSSPALTDLPVRDETNITSIWLDESPFPASHLPGGSAGGGEHPLPGATFLTSSYVNELEAHYTVGLDLRKGSALPGLSGTLTCNAGGALSQLTLIELVRR